MAERRAPDGLVGSDGPDGLAGFDGSDEVIASLSATMSPVGAPRPAAGTRGLAAVVSVLARSMGRESVSEAPATEARLLDPLTAIAAQKAGLAADGSGSIANATSVTNANAAVAAAVSLNAFIVTTPDHALAAADTIDAARAAGETLGAMAGVPIGMKDLFATNGVQTTAAWKVANSWALQAIDWWPVQLLWPGRMRRMCGS